MKKTIALLLAVMLLLLCGCTDTGTPQISKSTWVTYTQVKNRIKNEENKDIFVYSYQQPVISGSSDGIHMVNTKLNNLTSAFLYGSGGVDELTAMAKMDWKEPWFTRYTLEREFSVARVDDRVASFRYSDYVFNGGAHGNTYEHGITYDMVSGEQMTLASLAEDEAALQAVCRQHILAQLDSEDFPYREGLLPDYANYLDPVLKNWVLTEEGLQFIAQTYVISTYAVGTLRFTVPYEKLAHVMDEKWLPSQRGHGGGSISVTPVNSESPAATNFVIDDTGANLVVKVNGKIYDFSVEEMNSYQQNGSTVFYIVRQCLYSPLISSESFGLKIAVPETMPTAMLRYKDGSGKEYQYFLSYNGNKGTIELVEPETQIARY